MFLKRSSHVPQMFQPCSSGTEAMFPRHYSNVPPVFQPCFGSSPTVYLSLLSHILLYQLFSSGISQMSWSTSSCHIIQAVQLHIFLGPPTMFLMYSYLLLKLSAIYLRYSSHVSQVFQPCSSCIQPCSSCIQPCSLGIPVMFFRYSSHVL
jgi:hypothetical protein